VGDGVSFFPRGPLAFSRDVGLLEAKTPWTRAFTIESIDGSRATSLSVSYVRGGAGTF
jgi:hypothetical protein